MCWCARVYRRKSNVSIATKKGMHDAIVVPTALYDSEAWVLENKVKNRLDVAKISCLRSMCGVTWRNRVKNKEIRRRCGRQRSLSEKGEAEVLSCGGLDIILKKEWRGKRLVKKIYRADVEGNRRRGRPRIRWMDGGKAVWIIEG